MSEPAAPAAVATSPAEQRVLDALQDGPLLFRDVCAALSPMPEGEVARHLSRLKMNGLADHQGARWVRMSTAEATLETPAPAGATAEPEAELLQCPHCPFQTRSPRGFRAHVALKHRKRAPGSKPARAPEKPKPPAAPKVLPPAPPAIESTLERVRRIRDAAAQAVQALEALKAAGFVV